MSRRPLTLAHAALVAWAAVSIAAFALAFAAWPLLVVLPAAIASAVRRLDRIPPRAQRGLRWTGWIFAGVGAFLPLLVTFQGMTPDQAAKIAVPAGGGLCLLAALFLFSAPDWTPAKSVIPVLIALLAAAGLRRDSTLLIVLFAVAAGCAALHLAAYRPLRALPLALYVLWGGTVAASVCYFLPWAQPWVETKAGDFLAPSRSARAGLSLTSRLGEIEELGLSAQIAMRVWTDRPQYLRARVYPAFNGRVWSGAGGERRMLVPAPAPDPELARWLEDVPGATLAVPGSAEAPPRIRSRMLVDRPMAGVLPAPGQVSLARLDGNPAWIDGAGVLLPSRAAPELYALVNRFEGGIVQTGPAPGDDCLDASSATDVRLRELADRLRVGADPAERVRRTLAYLRSNCSYSLNVGVFRSADPVGEFVFDKRRGYCEYFASAAALLLRMQGVPSRYVVGYSVRPSNLEGGHYVVREADAHAWVEAWIAGRGWVEIDPTPAAQFEAMREPVRGGALAGHWERLKGWIAEAGAMIRQGGILAALGRWGLRAIVGAALIGLAAWLLRAGRRFSTGRRRAPALAADGSGGIPTELLDLMARLDRLWKRAGHPRPAARAPLEHLRGLPPAARLGGELVDAFYRCRYGGAAPTSEELAVLRRALPRG